MELHKLGFTSHKERKVRPDADLMAGALAGAISSLSVAPIDRTADAKSLGKFLGKDLTPQDRKSTINLIKKMYQIGKAEKGGSLGGFRGFYEGAGVKALKLAPATAISFVAYEQLKKRLNKKIF